MGCGRAPEKKIAELFLEFGVRDYKNSKNQANIGLTTLWRVPFQ
ncbi:hypothetical protein DESC_30002 [Desulfosarcina cetonica]|nr:hypothetical protein DESC_30002 [Desulfosarcina cetonica]